MSSANFAPFQPSPDERVRGQATMSSTSSASASIKANEESKINTSNKAEEALGKSSLEGDEGDYYRDDPRYATESYQSSTPQTPRSFGNGNHSSTGDAYQHSSHPQPAWAIHAASAAGVPQQRPAPGQSSFGSRPDHSSYSTAQGWNLSNLCFAAWAFPPFSSVMLLIYETENDLVRFHAYQAGIFGVASIVVLWILRSIFGWYRLSIIAGMAMLGYSWICGSNAANAAPTLTRSPYLAFLGPMADQWVGGE